MRELGDVFMLKNLYTQVDFLNLTADDISWLEHVSKDSKKS